MSREAVTLAGPQGMILVEDRMAIFSIQYQVLRANWPDLEVKELKTSHRDDVFVHAQQAAKGGRPVVLVPLNVDRPPPHWPLTRRGDLYMFD